MGMNFVVIIENLSGRTEEEINSTVGHQRFEREWACFDYEGQSYASWLCTPRYFQPEEHPELWEAVRKYLVRARHFLGGGSVCLGNDVVCYKLPEDVIRGEFFLPLRVPEEWFLEPDLTSHRELANVEELRGLSW